MNPHKRILQSSFCSHLLLGLAMVSTVARAEKGENPGPVIETHPKKTPVCAVVESLNGQVQVLSPDRHEILASIAHSPIPCGAWVAVQGEKSWVSIRHREGHSVHLAGESFVQVADHRIDGEHFVVLRGEVFGEAGEGAGELRVITANARARTVGGTFLLTYVVQSEDTQLVSIVKTSTLENRFEPGRSVLVKEGEASTLNFKLLRVVPSDPRAVAGATLKAKLENFPIDDNLMSQAVAAAYHRSERRFASLINSPSKNRNPASIAASDQMDSDDEKPAGPTHKQVAEASALKKHLIERVTGGTPEGAKLLARSPAALSSKKHSKTAESAEEQAAELEHNQLKEKEMEKHKLLEELSHTHEE